MGVPIQWGYQYNGGTNTMGVPIQWGGGGTRYNGGGGVEGEL